MFIRTSEMMYLWLTGIMEMRIYVKLKTRLDS